MPGMKVHCTDCRKLLGEEFPEVHRWLDQYVKDFPPPVFFDYHRSLVHNSYGLTIVRAEWGQKAYEAARLHLARDFDDNATIERLPKLVDRAVMWFNDVENMELTLIPSYMTAWKESLMAMLEENKDDDI